MGHEAGARAGWPEAMVRAWRELAAWHTAHARAELACGVLLGAGGSCGARPAVADAAGDGVALCWGHFVDETWLGPAICRDCGDGLTLDELERPDRRCADCGRLTPAEE